MPKRHSVADEAVTVVGAGIVGICCALSLQERGFRVRLVDRGEPGQETSFGNAGIISPWSIIPQAMPGVWRSIPGMLFDPNGPLKVRPSFWPKMIPWGLKFLRNGTEPTARRTSQAMEILCSPSIELFRRHLAGTGHEDLVLDSYYFHAFRNADGVSLNSLDYRIRRERGGDLELIGGAEIQALEPALSADFKAAVLIKGQARAVSPGKIGEILADKARAQGAEFIRANIQTVKQVAANSWQLVTDTGTIDAERLVMAAGVWSAELLKPLGLRLPLVAERGYHVEFPSPAVSLTHSIMDVDAKIVASSMLDGLRVAGSAEFGAIDAPADPRKKEELTSQARAMLPDLNTQDTQFWLGRRPSFPDSLPAVGPVKGHAGLFAAFGHSHYGLMMAPKTGELIADMVAGVPQNIDLSQLDPQRF